MMMRLVVVVAVASAVGGCAFTNPNNTPLLTALDDLVQPDSAWETVVMGPVFVPVGVACAALDIVVVHPARALVCAGQDTWRVVWAKPSGSFARQAALALPKLAVTPAVFVFAWAGESMFDLRPQQAKESP